ncbi:MAG: vitamin K epoxide reductase family protein [Nanopusillaceae archaeon]
MLYIILISAIAGCYIAYYIHRHKYNKKPLICPLRAKCDPVIHSEYSKFLGIENTILGFAYYSFILIFYLLFLIFRFKNYFLEFFVFNLSLLAVLFSIYLTFIQLFKLKKFCSWCLLSALLCFLIFINSYLIYKDTIINAAIKLQKLSIFIHALSAGIGLGVVSVVDYLFFKFLKDKKIDEKEKSILDNLSDFIWLILSLIIVSGVFIYLSDMNKYHNSVKFMFKMIIVLIIVINGFLMNLIISPKLIEFDFQKLNNYKEKIFVSMGVISITSWLLAFILGRLKSIPFTLIEALILYLLFLIVITISGIFFIKSKLRN